MPRPIVLAVASLVFAATAPAAFAHDERTVYVCEKADGDHVFLVANHAAAGGLTTSISATAEITLALFGAVCRLE